MYIDFKELKAQIEIVNVVDMLGLDLAQREGQLRGPCPACKEGDARSLVVTPEKNAYYCFAKKQGGDCIALAAHILDLSMRDAALRIAEHFDLIPNGNDGDEAKEPQGEPSKPLEPLAYLHYKHDAVQALGIDAETAEWIGIGYAKKGMMRGRVAIPIRTDEGTLVGYCGYAEDADPRLKFPRTLDLRQTS
jgi:DNA primase